MTSIRAIKAGFKRHESSQRDTRKVTITNESEWTFKKLYDWVASSFKLKKPILTYIDEDGDKITIASDQDLLEAFKDAKNQKLSYLRLKIFRKNRKIKDQRTVSAIDPNQMDETCNNKMNISSGGCPIKSFLELTKKFKNTPSGAEFCQDDHILDSVLDEIQTTCALARKDREDRRNRQTSRQSHLGFGDVHPILQAFNADSSNILKDIFDASHKFMELLIPKSDQRINKPKEKNMTQGMSQVFQNEKPTSNSISESLCFSLLRAGVVRTTSLKAPAKLSDILMYASKVFRVDEATCYLQYIDNEGDVLTVKTQREFDECVKVFKSLGRKVVEVQVHGKSKKNVPNKSKAIRKLQNATPNTRKSKVGKCIQGLDTVKTISDEKKEHPKATSGQSTQTDHFNNRVKRKESVSKDVQVRQSKFMQAMDNVKPPTYQSHIASTTNCQKTQANRVETTDKSSRNKKPTEKVTARQRKVSVKEVVRDMETSKSINGSYSTSAVSLDSTNVHGENSSATVEDNNIKKEWENVTRVVLTYDGDANPQPFVEPFDFSTLAKAGARVFNLKLESVFFTYIDDENDEVVVKNDSDLTESLDVFKSMKATIVYKVNGDKSNDLIGYLRESVTKPTELISKKVSRFEAQQKHLKEMGFHNSVRNLQLLTQYNGNVEFAVQKLLNESK